jgi:uncharacterized BrkB/YihY/UPF0761 family membrane protein
MDRLTLSKFLAILISIIFSLDFLAGKFYWYSTLWFFDVFMHFLGGLFLAFLFFWIFSGIKPSVVLTVKILTGVLLVGISWEIFELVFNNYVAENPFNVLDTLSDLVLDLAGGLSGIFYMYKKIGDTRETTI